MKAIIDEHGPMGPHRIAELCKVSERTARRWLSGKTKAPATARKLVELHLRGRIMPEKWPHHWHFNSSNFLDTGHKQALKWQQIDWYLYSCQCWYQLLNLLPQIEARIDELCKTASKADVIDLKKYREELDALKKRPFSLPPDFREYYETGEIETHRKFGC